MYTSFLSKDRLFTSSNIGRMAVIQQFLRSPHYMKYTILALVTEHSSWALGWHHCV